MEQYKWETVHPYVVQDLEDAHIVALYDWVKIFYGRTRNEIDKWTLLISKLRWFEDSIIQTALYDYCCTREEAGRYDPLVRLLDRIVELARGALPGVPAKDSYPVDDLCFANCAHHEVVPIPEHGPLGARCCPDIAVLRRRHALQLTTKGGKIRWPNLLLYWKLRAWQNLTEMLDAERQRRKLPPAQEWMTALAAKQVRVQDFTCSYMGL